MEEINKWLEHWEPTWLFLILFVETLISGAILLWTIKEYYYDYQKDTKKKTRSQKVVVSDVAGSNVGDKREGQDTGGEEVKGSQEDAR